ncbi:MAG: PorT family protein [Flammeovirgaceae bacterium]|nr:PorT family protein [Flammeovirgaceae bacterium]
MSLDSNSYFLVKELSDAVNHQGKLNYSAGVIIYYDLNDRFTLKSKLLYSTKNFAITYDFQKLRDETFDGISVVKKATYQYFNSYIDIPLEIGYKLSENKHPGYVTLGFTNSFLVGYDTKGYFFDPTPEKVKSYNDYLLSIKSGYGKLFKTKSLGIYLEPQFRIYLNRVMKFNKNNSPKQNPMHFGIELQLLKL